MEGEGFLSAIEEETKKIIPFDPMDSSVLNTTRFDFDTLRDCTTVIPDPDKALSDKVDLPGTKELLEDDSWVEPGDQELGNDRPAPNGESSVRVPVTSDPQPALHVSQIVKNDDDDDVVYCDEEDEVIRGPIKSKNELQSLPPVPPVQVTLQPSHQTVPVGIVLSNLGTKVVVEGTQTSFVPEFANDEKEAVYKRLKKAHGGTFVNTGAQGGPFSNTGPQGGPFHNIGGQRRLFQTASGQAGPSQNIGGHRSPFQGEQRPPFQGGQNTSSQNTGGGQEHVSQNAKLGGPSRSTGGGQGLPFQNTGAQGAPFQNTMAQRGSSRPFQNTGAQGGPFLITGRQSPPLQGPETQNAGGQGWSGHTGHNVSPANASNNESPQQQHFNRGGAHTGHGRGRENT